MRHRLAPSIATGMVDVYTLHAFGMRLLRRGTLDADKAYKCWRRLRVAGGHAEWLRVRRYLDQLVSRRSQGVLLTRHG
jgi:hypothetical protein